VQVTYMRPGQFVEYHNINGKNGNHPVSKRVCRADAGLGPAAEQKAVGVRRGRLRRHQPLRIVIDGKVALQPAHYGSALVGGASAITCRRRSIFLLADLLAGARGVRSTVRRGCIPSAARYNMRAVPAEKVAENRRRRLLLSLNIVRRGITTNC